MLDRRYLDPYYIGSLMEEIFSPRKLPRHRYSSQDGYVYGQIEKITDGEGTKDKPSIIKRGSFVWKKYKSWYDDDGSYHEELVDDSFEPPRGAEITNGD